MKRFVLCLAVLGSTGCDDRCEAVTGIKCENRVRIDFTSPIAAPGDYTFAIEDSGTTRQCTTSLPSLATECDPQLQLENDGPGIVAMWINAAPATLVLTVSHGGDELYTFTITPMYPPPSACNNSCPFAVTDAFTSPGDSGVDAGQDGSTDGGSASCDRTLWSGTYNVSYEPVDTTCPMLPSRDYSLLEGVEQLSFCTVVGPEWSSDGCTRTARLNCRGEGMSYTWDLELTQIDADANELTGTSHVQVTQGEPMCGGDYNVTYTRYPGT